MINSLSIVTQNQPHDANVPESSKLSATIATALLYTITVVTQAYAVPVTADFPDDSSSKLILTKSSEHLQHLQKERSLINFIKSTREINR
jgi:hypothetical protein